MSEDRENVRRRVEEMSVESLHRSPSFILSVSLNPESSTLFFSHASFSSFLVSHSNDSKPTSR